MEDRNVRIHWSFIKDIIAYVQDLRKIHFTLYLIPDPESLKVQNQDLGSFQNLYILYCLLFCLTEGTAPLIIDS